MRLGFHRARKEAISPGSLAPMDPAIGVERLEAQEEDDEVMPESYSEEAQAKVEFVGKETGSNKEIKYNVEKIKCDMEKIECIVEKAKALKVRKYDRE